MSVQLNQDLKVFYLSKFGGEGGGEGGYTYNIYISYVNFRSLCFRWVPFNHDKTKFRTKLICLLRMNIASSRIPPSVMLPVLSVSACRIQPFMNLSVVTVQAMN